MIEHPNPVTGLGTPLTAHVNWYEAERVVR